MEALTKVLRNWGISFWTFQEFSPCYGRQGSMLKSRFRAVCCHLW